MKSKTLSMTADPRPEDSHRTIQDILNACVVRGANILAMIDTLARAESFQGAPADCMEALSELMARRNEDLAEAHERCEGRGQSSGGTR